MLVRGKSDLKLLLTLQTYIDISLVSKSRLWSKEEYSWYEAQSLKSNFRFGFSRVGTYMFSSYAAEIVVGLDRKSRSSIDIWWSRAYKFP